MTQTAEETPKRARPIDDSGPTARYGIVAVGAAFILALATFVVFAGMTPILPTANVVEALLLGDGIVILVLLLLIGRISWPSETDRLQAADEQEFAPL